MLQSLPLIRALWGKHSLLEAIAANLVLALVGLAEPVFSKGGVPALYPTQAEAEKAAKLHFNCTGAHKMGDQWMPCAKHGQAESSQQSGHQH
jgi:hypothetical protein